VRGPLRAFPTRRSSDLRLLRAGAGRRRVAYGADGMSMIAPSTATVVAVEARKAAASRVLLATGGLLVAGVGTLAGLMTAAARGGNDEIRAQLGTFADAEPWPQLVGAASQITAAAGFLAFGVALSWLVGREFADRTI